MLRIFRFSLRILALVILLIAIGLWPSVPDASGQAPQPRMEKLDAGLRRHLAVRGGVALTPTFITPSGITPSGSPERGLRRAARPLPEVALARLQELDFAYSPSDNTVRALIKTNGSLDGIEELGVTVQSTLGDIYAVRIPVDALAALTNLPNVEFIEAARKLSLTNDISVPSTGATAFHDAGLDGSGAIVAVIDTGVDFTHQDFRNADGTTRIKYICDQTDPPQAGDGTCPGGGTSDGGTLWTESQINAALTGSGTVRQNDTNGHGTHVLGTAAGDDSVFRGMAPGADIIVVKSDLGTDNIINAMGFIDQKAAELGLPYVINMSFGGHFGPHDGTDLLSVAIDNLVGPGIPGKAVIVAAGNEGSDFIHASGDVMSGDQVVDFTIPSSTTTILIHIWYSGSDSFALDVTDPLGNGFVGIQAGASEIGCIGVTWCLNAVSSGTLSNGSKEITFSVVDFSSSSISPTGTWSFKLSQASPVNGSFNAWIADCKPSDDCQFTSSHASNFGSVGEPGVAQDAITVGSYTTRNCWNGQSGQVCYSPLPTVGAISSFSSLGPTRDNRPKPDIAAPGEAVMSSLSVDNSFSQISSITDFGGKHAAIQGTSMAAPHVTGAVALLLANDPTLDSEEIKALLQGNAIQDAFTGVGCNNTWGCGKLNIQALVPVPVMSVTKSATPNSVMVGDPITFTVSATNTGPIRAESVTITDVLPLGVSFVSAAGCAYDSPSRTVTCDVGNVEIGDSVSRDIVVSATQVGSFVNDASVFAGSDLMGTDSAGFTATSNLTITKEADVSSVFLGDLITFALQVTNIGSAASNSVSMTDALPSSVNFHSAAGCSYDSPSHTVTCQFGTLNGGDVASSTIVAIPTAAGQITNQASVAANGVSMGSDSVTFDAVIPPDPVLLLSKNVDPATVLVGEQTTFTITTNNIGLVPAASVIITDTLPAETSFVSAAAGCSYDGPTHTVTCTVSDLDVNEGTEIWVDVIADNVGTFTNQAAVSSDGVQRATAAANLTSDPTLVISKQATSTSVFIGDTVTFAIDVTNVGSTSSTAVIVTDSLPGGLEYFSSSPSCSFDGASDTVTCSLGVLAAGQSASSTVVAIAASVGDITNEAFVSGDGIAMSSDNAMVTVAPIVLITKSADKTAVPVGKPVTFLLKVRNTGASTSTAVTVIDAIPPELLFDSAGNPNCGYDPDTTTVTCSFGDIGPGGLATSTVVTIGQVEGTAINTASVTSDSPFPSTLHSTATAVVGVTPANQPPTANAGTDQTVTLPSSATLNGVVSDDGLPSGTLTVAWSQNSGPATVTFANSASASTSASFPTAGTYVLRLTAFDGEFTASDNATFTVLNEQSSSSSGGGGGGGGGLSIAPEIGFRPQGGFQFGGVVGGENPEPQTLVIWTARDRSVLRFNLSSDVPWIGLEQLEGISDSPGDKERIDISVDISGLDVGTHVGTITIAGRKARNDPQHFNVTLVIEDDIPDGLDDLVELLESVDLVEAVTIMEDAGIEKAAELTAALESRRAADIIGQIAADIAGAILGELDNDRVIEMLRASEPSQLQKPLSEMAPADFRELIDSVDTADLLLEKLPLVPAEQLLSVRIALADPDIPAPVATETGPSVTMYKVQSVSQSGWTKLVGSPDPIDNILAKFSRVRTDVQVEVELLDELPKELPDIEQGRLVYAAFNVELNDIGPDDIDVAQVTLGLDREWITANGIHRWSIELGRYDKEFESWTYWPARLVDETDEELIYVAAVPGFSTFAVTGMTSLVDSEFVVSNLRVLPPSGIEGQRMVAMVEVINNGTVGAVYGANLWIDKALVASGAVAIPSGQNAQLSFMVTESIGNHSVRIDRLIREFEVRPKFNLLTGGQVSITTAAPTPEATAVPEPEESSATEGARELTPIVSPTASPVLTSTPATSQQPPSPTPTPTKVRASAQIPAAPLPPEETGDASEIRERLGDVPQTGGGGNAIIIGMVLAAAVGAVVAGYVMNRRAARRK